MDHIDKDEELVCPLCGGQVLWMPVSHIYVCEHCKQSYSEGNGVYLRKERKATVEKSSAVSNAAKLREALETLRELLGDLLRLEDAEYHNDFSNFCDIIDAAPSAPPRNCDRFATATEAWDAYDEWVESYRSKGKTPPFNEFGWLFAPAAEQEGGAE